MELAMIGKLGNFWLLLTMLTLAIGCGGGGTPAKTTVKKPKKTSSNSYSKRAPGPASKQRTEYNQNAGKSLAAGPEFTKLWIADLKSGDTDKIKTAIEELRNLKAKAAVPELEKLAKAANDSDIRRRAAAAASYLKGL
ncbi:MAG: hypothetical protein SFX18_05005 [Pirellulales bacterium]|nr:hypothetical protein [Pirellulales bacterium]